MNTVCVHLGDRTIDLLTGRMEPGGGVLRPLELRVLQVLARSAPHPVSAKRLLTEVFGYHADSASQTPYTTIRRLRQAVEADADAPEYVLSARGEGYRLVAALTDGPASTLPPEPPGFFGPQEPLDALTAQVTTFIGPGGAGKSRAALRFAHRRAAAGEAVAWLADPGASLWVAAARRWNTEPTPEAIADRLEPGWVVIDDVTDAIEEAAGLARAAGPEVRFVFTSRRPLDLPGEALFEVGPLAPSDAVALLVSRAALHRGGRWTPSHDDAPALARIADRVDHLPLGLELAAVRLGSIAPEVVAAQLDDRAPLRTVRAGVPERHQSLRAVMAWSWDRLDPRERGWLTGVSALEGAFDLDLAEAALGPLDEDWDTGAALTHLHRLGLIAASDLPRRPLRALSTVSAAVADLADPAAWEAALDRVARRTAERASTLARTWTLRRTLFDGGQDDLATLRALARSRSRGFGDPSETLYVEASLLAGVCHRAAADAAFDALRAADPSPELRARAALTQYGAWAMWARPGGVERMDEAFHDPTLPPADRVALGFALAMRDLVQGVPTERLHALEPLCAASPPEVAAQLQVHRTLIDGLLIGTSGRCADAREAFRASEARARAAGSVVVGWLLHAYAAFSLIALCRPHEAVAELEVAHRALLDAQDRGVPTRQDHLLVGAMLLRGLSATDATRAAEFGRTLVLELRRWGATSMVVDAEREWIEALVRAGRVEEAGAALERLERRPSVGRLHDGRRALARAWVAAAGGRPDLAAIAARSALDAVSAWERFGAAELLAEALVGVDRVEEALAAIAPAFAPPDQLVAPGSLWALRHALGELTADQAAAGILATQREDGDLRLAAALRGRHPSPPPHDPDGTVTGWLDVLAGRPPSRPIPPYRYALRRAAGQ
ncbi:MAG: winged helix-turn-helix domain-containing protein [Myxococcota bacterium]